MSKLYVFAKGKGQLSHESTLATLKYIPRSRTPWQPSTHGRQNMIPADMADWWGKGRPHVGNQHPNSPYTSSKSSSLEERQIQLIPKQELEKYMPNIELGPKALVTPVSLMAARQGHRVTHDLLHSYDPFIGAVDKPTVVDHDKITHDDPNRVGLHPATIHSRGRIYRWLRRGPFFQEDHYFRRSVAPIDGSTANRPPILPEDVRLAKKVVKLARRGHLKAACEEYRKFVSVPPVEVYRALTAACVPGAKIADAVAILEEGTSKMFYIARDAEVLTNVMKCAIKAKNRSRVMWVYNVARGRYYENKVARAEIEPQTMYTLSTMALEFLLDHDSGEEARTLYCFLAENSLLNNDIYIRVGKELQATLAKGEKIGSYQDSLADGLSLTKNVAPIAEGVSQLLAGRDEADAASDVSLSDVVIPRYEGETAVSYLSRRFADVDVAFVVRLARFKNDGKTDLVVKSQQSKKDNVPNAPNYIEAYCERALSWLLTLSATQAVSFEAQPMPYMRKSKPSTVNANVRVAYLPENRKPTALTATEQGFTFHFDKNSRFVEETFRQQGDTLESKLLAQRRIHKPVSQAVRFDGEVDASHSVGGKLEQQRALLETMFPTVNMRVPAARVLHPSVFSASGIRDLHREVVGASGDAATSGSTMASDAAMAAALATAPLGNTTASRPAGVSSSDGVNVAESISKMDDKSMF